MEDIDLSKLTKVGIFTLAGEMRNQVILKCHGCGQIATEFMRYRDGSKALDLCDECHERLMHEQTY